MQPFLTAFLLFFSEEFLNFCFKVLNIFDSIINDIIFKMPINSKSTIVFIDRKRVIIFFLYQLNSSTAHNFSTYFIMNGSSK